MNTELFFTQLPPKDGWYSFTCVLCQLPKEKQAHINYANHTKLVGSVCDDCKNKAIELYYEPWRQLIDKLADNPDVKPNQETV
jgi:hypothetical protein